jgi:hypothetical protein
MWLEGEGMMDSGTMEIKLLVVVSCWIRRLKLWFFQTVV